MSEPRWRLVAVLVGVLGCGEQTPSLTPSTLEIDAQRVPLRIEGLAAHDYLRTRADSLVLVGDYGARIGGVETLVVAAAGDGVTVTLTEPLPPGFHALDLHAEGRAWHVEDALEIIPRDLGPDAGTGDGSVDGPAGGGAVYATTATDLYRLDPATGVTSHIGTYPCASTVVDVAVNRAGEILIVAGPSLYVVSANDASCTLRATLVGVTSDVGALEYIRDVAGADILLGITAEMPGKLYAIDPMTGAGTPRGTLGSSKVARGDLTWMTGIGLRATVTQVGVDSLSAIDEALGNATPLGTVPPITGLVTQNGALYGLSLDGAVRRLDPATGNILASRATGLAWTGAATPPPPR